jgi:hypothetical protein
MPPFYTPLFGFWSPQWQSYAPEFRRQMIDAARRKRREAVLPTIPPATTSQQPARPSGDDFIPAPARILWPLRCLEKADCKFTLELERGGPLRSMLVIQRSKARGRSGFWPKY